MTGTTRLSRGRRAPKPPLDVRLTVTFRFGDEADDRVTVMNDRSVPLVGTVFQSRDAILRGFARLLVKAASRQPRVAAEILSLQRFIRPRRQRDTKAQ